MKSRPPFDQEEKRRELRCRLNQIPSVDLPETAIALRPTIPLSTFSDKAAMNQLMGILDWVVGEIKAT